jgi:hypothetical protein
LLTDCANDAFPSEAERERHVSKSCEKIVYYSHLSLVSTFVPDWLARTWKMKR